jgi:hypothetical protein
LTNPSDKAHGTEYAEAEQRQHAETTEEEILVDWYADHGLAHVPQEEE